MSVGRNRVHGRDDYIFEWAFQISPFFFGVKGFELSTAAVHRQGHRARARLNGEKARARWEEKRSIATDKGERRLFRRVGGNAASNLSFSAKNSLYKFKYAIPIYQAVSGLLSVVLSQQKGSCSKTTARAFLY